MNKVELGPKETPKNGILPEKKIDFASIAPKAKPVNANAKKDKENPAAEAVQATLDVAKMKNINKPESVLQEAMPEKSVAQSSANGPEDLKKSEVPIGPSPQDRNSEAVPAKDAVQSSPAPEEMSPEKITLAAPKLDTTVLVDECMAKICPNVNLPVNKGDESGHANSIALKFHERVRKYIESEMTTMTDEDKKGFADPQHLSEFS